MVDIGSGVGVILVAGGIILIAIEFTHPGMFIIIPGTIVTASGFIYILDPGLLTASIFGPLIVAAVAILSALLTLPIYQRLGKIHPPMTTILDSLKGETGLVIVPIVPDSMSGKVRIHSEVWSARSEHAIPVGARVEVTGGQGVSVWVRPVEEKEPLLAS
ncbi:MAG: NfeD family protein [Thermoplasmata archaeon]